MKAVLSNKIARSFVGSSFISFFGDTIFYLAMVTFAATTPNPSFAITAVTFSESIPRILDVVCSHYAQQTKRKYGLLILADFLRAAMYSVIAIMFFTGVAEKTFLVIVVINFISDMLGKYRNGLDIALFTTNVSQELFQPINTLEQFGYQLINVFALLLGGIILSFLSYGAFASVNAATFILAALIMISIHAKIKVPATEATQKIGLFPGLKNTIVILKQKPIIFQNIALFAFLNASLSTMSPIAQLQIAHHPKMVIGSYSFTVALITGSVLVGFLLGNLVSKPAQKIFHNSTTQLRLAILLLILAIGSIETFNAWIIVVLQVGFGLSIGAATPSFMTELMTSFEPDELTVVAGFMNSMVGLATPVLSMTLMLVASTASVNVALIVFAICALAVFSTKYFLTGDKQKAEKEEDQLDD